MTQISMSIIILMYFTKSRPFDSKLQNIFEFYNEVSLLIVAYLLVPLAAYDINSDTQYNIGWAITIITLTNLGANYVNLLVSVIIGICLSIKKLWQSYKAKKQAK